MAATDAESWYDDLYSGNCVRIMETLRKNPRLVSKGLEPEPNRRDSRGTTWKGRTALHVGAHRGCRELVAQIVDIFNLEEKPSAPPQDITSLAEPGMIINDRKVAEMFISDRKNVRSSGKQKTTSRWVDYSAPKAVAELEKVNNPERVLGNLLAAKDGFYQLDALAMAVLNGNRDVIQLLRDAIVQCGSNVDEALRRIVEEPTDASSYDGKWGEPHQIIKEQLREISKAALARHSQDSVKIEERYSRSKNFNFLPIDQYLFHFSFTVTSANETKWAESVRQDIFGKTKDSDSLRRFLLELKDGQGRTALHVAIDNNTVDEFLEICIEKEVREDWDVINAPDSVGRTPLHRATYTDSLNSLVRDPRTNLNGGFYPGRYAEVLSADFGLDVNRLSERNGCTSWLYSAGFTSLHAAILHRERDKVQSLLSTEENGTLDAQWVFARWFPDAVLGSVYAYYNCLQLAALVGDASIMQLLLQDSRFRELLSVTDERWWSRIPPVLHIVAASANIDILTMFLDKKYDIDPLQEDDQNNTALHYATKGLSTRFPHTMQWWGPHLLDYVNADHILWAPNAQLEAEEVGYEKRKGCVNLLLQAGIDIWKTNRYNEPPGPGHDSPPHFLAWWYEKLTRETLGLQTRLNTAANAISVTAALVATASYVGPLQPPLGYGGDFSTVQTTSLPVRIFMVCNTLSFYFAVAAIMLAVIPALPMPQESTMDELNRTRRIVATAVGFLFPSIIAVLIAFAAGSVAVIPNDGAWNDGGLTVSTAAIGGSICSIVILLFFLRLLRLIFHTSVWIRKFYKCVYKVTGY